jgi:hypothetical protein
MSIDPSRAISSQLQPVLDAVLVMARAQGLDQKSLAARAGVRAETVTRAKSRGSIDWVTLKALADATGVDLRVVATPRAAGNRRSGLADPSLKLAWSNPDASVPVLIAKAIERGSFDLILKAAWEHGIHTVGAVAQRLRDEGAVPDRSLDFADRALRNIAIGAARAQSASAH